MPDTPSCTAGSGPPPLPGSLTASRAGACPQRAAAARTGLPLSVWPGIPWPGCPAPRRDASSCPRSCPGPRAWPVLTALSRPGDLVAVIPGAGCPGLAAAAARAGRGILGAGPGDSGYPGRAALAVMVSRDDRGPGGDDAAYAACHRALRPGGVLAVIAGRPGPGDIPDLSLAVARARAAGLVYAQHVVLVHAAIDGDQLRPLPGPGLDGASPAEDPLSARIHSDLLVLTKPGGLDAR
jgi:hypothetical protein